MINLDQIEQRIGRGQVTPADIQALAGEAINLSLQVGAVLDRIGKGYSGPAEVSALFGAVESAYLTLYQRPTAAQRRATDLAAQQAAIAQSNSDRLAASQAQAVAEVNARAAWHDNASQVEMDKETAVGAVAALERFNAAKAAADAELAERAKKKHDLENILNA